MPLVNRTFDQLIDFTRTSAATFVNSSGNIASTPQSRNLLTFTQEFDNAAWTKTNAEIVPNQNPAAASLGPELVTNGDFASGTTGWSAVGGGSIAVVSGEMEVTGGGAFSGARQTITTVAGRVYRMVFTGRRGTTTQDVRAVGAGGALSVLITSTTPTTLTVYGVATTTSTTIDLLINNASASGTAYFDNVSLREVIGGALQAPDGTFTADTLVEDTTNAAHTVSSGNATVALGAVTWSVYAKAGTRSWMWLNAFAGGNNRTWFNLANGTVGTTGAGATASITSVGNGWYRCSVTLTSGTTTVSMGINAASADNTTSYAGTSGAGAIFIWGAQLEQASAATDYTRNFGGLFPPRFDYDPVTRAPRGLLIEEQRTNFLRRSEEFDNAVWTNANPNVPAVTANSTVAPDGTTTADTLTAATGGTVSQSRQIASSTGATGNFTGSVYLKAGTSTRSQIIMSDTTSGFNVVGDFSITWTAGVATVQSVAFGTASITNAGNGWYRCVITGNVPSANASVAFAVLPDSVSGTGSVIAWGAQLEAGAFATSYIPTVASQVTRTADQAVIQAPNFASWYNQSSGTFVVEADSFANITAAIVYRAFGASDGTGNNVITGYMYNGAWGDAVVVGGAFQADLSRAGSYTANTPAKFALAYAANDFAVSVSGNTAITDTSGTIPTVDRLGIGALNSINQLNGHLRSIRYYPTRLSNAQLQALTA